jgi:TIR domain-containing protein
MTVEVAAKQVIDRLTYFRQRLSNISQQLQVMEDVGPVYELLRRWMERASSYISENISETEADYLRKKQKSSSGATYSRLTEDFRVIDAILAASIESLEDDPSFILKNVASIDAARLKQQRSSQVAFDVFVSYSSVDQEQATLLSNAIDAAGRKAFLSAKDLKPGDDFAEEIRSRLINSRELWLLVSPNSLKSEWVLTEWGAAWVLGKRIIPILHRCKPDDLPDRIRKLHCIDFYKYPDLIKRTFQNT